MDERRGGEVLFSVKSLLSGVLRASPSADWHGQIKRLLNSAKDLQSS